MLIAHLVPAYFAATWSRPYWKPEWTERQRVALWIAAYGSTVAPDLDVIYNSLFRGFFGHTTLWTHSLFPYLGAGIAWWAAGRSLRLGYAHTMIGLVVVGGLSHLALDVIAHSTPLLYPVSMYMFGAPSTRVLEGKLLGYLTDPIVLLEPALVALAAGHRVIHHRSIPPRLKKSAVFSLAAGLVALALAYLSMLPTLQRIAGTELLGTSTTNHLGLGRAGSGETADRCVSTQSRSLDGLLESRQSVMMVKRPPKKHPGDRNRP